MTLHRGSGLGLQGEGKHGTQALTLDQGAPLLASSSSKIESDRSDKHQRR